MTEDWQLRSRMLMGDRALSVLAASHVAVFGLGGVGSYAAESLARSGVGTLTLVDHDEVGRTNINRQACALHSTVGLPKCEVMARRALDINPAAVVHPICKRYDAETRDEFWNGERYDFIVDAIDLVTCKLDLICTAISSGIPIISALGTGNKLDASRLKIADIADTHDCRFARVMRKELRSRGVIHHSVVYSDELPIKAAQLDDPPPGRRSVPASAPWVPASAGLLMAGYVVRKLTGI